MSFSKIFIAKDYVWKHRVWIGRIIWWFRCRVSCPATWPSGCSSLDNFEQKLSAQLTVQVQVYGCKLARPDKSSIVIKKQALDLLENSQSSSGICLECCLSVWPFFKITAGSLDLTLTLEIFTYIICQGFDPSGKPLRIRNQMSHHIPLLCHPAIINIHVLIAQLPPTIHCQTVRHFHEESLTVPQMEKQFIRKQEQVKWTMRNNHWELSAIKFTVLTMSGFKLHWHNLPQSCRVVVYSPQ